MHTFSTVGFTKSGQPLFTPEEVRKLMHVEFERAQRYGYPIACMMIQIDRIDPLHTIHGYESKEEVLRKVVDLVKRETRASDFLGCMVDDRLLAVIPHTHPEAAGFLAKRLLKGARALHFQSSVGTVRISLSIGLSHNRHPGALSFETLVRVAEEGLAVADAGGGDRCVETELYQLYENRRDPSRPSPSELLGGKLGDFENDEDYRRKLLALVQKDGDLEAAAAQLAEEIISRALRDVEAERVRVAAEAPPQAPDAPAPADLDPEAELTYKREIDLLQRRIAKLTQSLGLTERELERLRSLKDVEGGMESIYRNVQGLGDEELHRELKRELMAKIFEANLDLRRQTG